MFYFFFFKYLICVKYAWLRMSPMQWKRVINTLWPLWHWPTSLMLEVSFSTKLVTIKTFIPHAKQQFRPVQEPQSMCTRIVRQNKAQHQEGANSFRAKCITIACQDNDRHGNTSHWYIILHNYNMSFWIQITSRRLLILTPRHHQQSEIRLPTS